MGDDIEDILGASSLISTPYSVEHLAGDGSQRRFFRVAPSSGPGMLLVLPADHSEASLREARSCLLIGRHLAQKGIAVPEIYYFCEESGAIIYEDLGDKLLHERLRTPGDGLEKSAPLTKVSSGAFGLFQDALSSLARLQVRGAEGFEKNFCWQGSFYDYELITTRECGYFLDSFCRGFLGMKIAALAFELEKEFASLARRALRESGTYLLHRDYQSRNLMVRERTIRIIDFQGARFGPLAYDAASLLNDPYVNLGALLRKKLLSYYIERLKEYTVLDEAAFLAGYKHIALLRNLQVLGAYAFLSRVRHKHFFQDYIPAALDDLRARVRGELAGRYPRLTDLVERAVEKYETL